MNYLQKKIEKVIILNIIGFCNLQYTTCLQK